jgi:hypothetical protein
MPVATATATAVAAPALAAAEWGIAVARAPTRARTARGSWRADFTRGRDSSGIAGASGP